MPPVIKTFLEISDSHLPLWYRDGGRHDGIIMHDMEHGALMWVPDDPKQSAGLAADGEVEFIDDDDETGAEFAEDFMFDQDASEEPELPTFDEPSATGRRPNAATRTGMYDHD